MTHLDNLGTLPPFVSAHAFCASWNGLGNSGFLKMAPTDTEQASLTRRYFCVVDDYAGLAKVM